MKQILRRNSKLAILGLKCEEIRAKNHYKHLTMMKNLLNEITQNLMLSGQYAKTKGTLTLPGTDSQKLPHLQTTSLEI